MSFTCEPTKLNRYYRSAFPLQPNDNQYPKK